VQICPPPPEPGKTQVLALLTKPEQHGANQLYTPWPAQSQTQIEEDAITQFPLAHSLLEVQICPAAFSALAHCQPPCPSSKHLSPLQQLSSVLHPDPEDTQLMHTANPLPPLQHFSPLQQSLLELQLCPEDLQLVALLPLALPLNPATTASNAVSFT